MANQNEAKILETIQKLGFQPYFRSAQEAVTSPLSKQIMVIGEKITNLQSEVSQYQALLSMHNIDFKSEMAKSQGVSAIKSEPTPKKEAPTSSVNVEKFHNSLLFSLFLKTLGARSTASTAEEAFSKILGRLENEPARVRAIEFMQWLQGISPDTSKTDLISGWNTLVRGNRESSNVKPPVMPSDEVKSEPMANVPPKEQSDSEPSVVPSTDELSGKTMIEIEIPQEQLENAKSPTNPNATNPHALGKVSGTGLAGLGGIPAPQFMNK